MKSVVKDIFQVGSRSPLGRFGTKLGLTPEELEGTLRVESVDTKSSKVSVCIPNWCCNERDGRFRLSAAIAMLDEISTFAGVCAWDRNLRGGVSIQLAGRVVDGEGYIDAGATDRIDFVTHKVKVGKTIAFIKVGVEMNGKKLVQANHIKFMPMGWPMDSLFAPIPRKITYPLTKLLVERFPIHDQTVPDDIDSVFPFNDNNQLLITPDYGNPFGTLHGGASVMMTALVAERNMQEIDHPKPRWMKANLINGVATNANKTADLRIQENCSVSSRASLVCDGEPRSETVIEWNVQGVKQ